MALHTTSLLKPITAQLVICAAAVLSAHTASGQSIDLGDYSAPATVSYQNSFSSQQSQFTDWYSFSVQEANFNGITASISFAQVFGIQLTTELYSGSLNGNQINIGSLITSGNTSHTVFGNAVQTTSVFQPSHLSGGDYLIKVSGAVIGSLGGSYAGVANMAPVPLPPTLPLMAVGLGLVGLITRKRKHT